MKIQVIDVGNTFLKVNIWEMIEGETPKLRYDHHTPTSKDMRDNLEVIDNAYANQEQDAIIILSMSDSVVYENKEGQRIWIPAGEPTHPYARLDQLPPYRETGKPQGEILSGIFNQLQMVKTMVQTQGFGNTRILPMSTYIAAHLAVNPNFNNWDITHASNSGVYNYRIPNPNDLRYPNNGWHQCIDDIIHCGHIGKEILPCNFTLKTPEGIPVLIGGHDTTFANATHIPFSTKPYISCSTWLTISIESEVLPDKEGEPPKWIDDGTRYVVAPNGAVLKQICVPSPQHRMGKIEVAERTLKFLEKHLMPDTTAPILIFGGWRNVYHELLANASTPFEFETTGPHHLSECAAHYAYKSLNA